MLRILLIFISLFLTACSSPVLPSQRQDLLKFIPKEEVEKVVNLDDLNFVKENFPKSCVWKKLERVVDGDTIIVDDDIRVRLIGVDTPETKHPTKKIQKFGLESSVFTKNFLKNVDQVCLMEDPVGDKIDIYGRTLSYVFREDGQELNTELLKVGLARGYFYFLFSRKEEFRIFENLAKEKTLNLWK